MFIGEIFNKQLNENAETLNIGDPVTIVGKVQFQGSTGEIAEFGKDKRFVIVNLYNHGRHSFHSSDVEYNDYADSDDEDMRMYDNDKDYRNWHSSQEMDEALDLGRQKFIVTYKNVGSGKTYTALVPADDEYEARDRVNQSAGRGTSVIDIKPARGDEPTDQEWKVYKNPNMPAASQVGLYDREIDESHYTGYNPPFRGVGGARGREDDEGWENEKNNDYWSKQRNTKPQMVGMYFYNVTPADEQDALAIGLKKTKSGKWALAKYNTSGSGFARNKASADIAFGRGTYWEPKKTFEEKTSDVVAEPEVTLPPPENAQKTQIAGTLPTYKKGKAHLDTHQPTGKTLDFGAGLGGGAAEMGADSYEPFPRKGFEPTYTKSSEIPSDSYHRVTNFNVLNVVPQNIRNTIVSEIGRVLAPGGIAIITTRGKDVMSAKGADGPEPMSRLTTIGTYQKGFTTKELMGYVQQVLGQGFEVRPIKLGPAGVLIRKSNGLEESIDSNDFEQRRCGKSAKDLGGADAWYHRGCIPDYYGYEKGSQDWNDYVTSYKEWDEGPSGGKQW